MHRYFDPAIWGAVPYHFWSLVFFTLGCIVGSFLNVCIHRMPRGMSIVSPPSHCPHCGYSIPWYRNVPLITWLWQRGRCANCAAPISSRYFFVELLTGLAFLASWLAVGRQSAPMALAYCLLLSGFIVATFIDFEHFIIPDEITIGGMFAGVICSALAPALHSATLSTVAMQRSLVGLVVGAGMVYGVLRLGKMMFGRLKVDLPENARVIFTETALVLPDREVPYEDIFYRKSDTIALEARTVELVDRCFKGVPVRLSPKVLRIGDEEFNPETIIHMEVVATKLVLPREAMGFGDVKFMGAIGAFLGWQATLFSLMVSSMIGAAVGLTFIVLRRREWSSRIPYGPYIALAAVLWMFGGKRLLTLWLAGG
jgi:leader peptidase (prepilin peptidase)/N-methyltransferase